MELLQAGSCIFISSDFIEDKKDSDNLKNADYSESVPNIVIISVVSLQSTTIL